VHPCSTINACAPHWSIIYDRWPARFPASPQAPCACRKSNPVTKNIATILVGVFGVADGGIRGFARRILGVAVQVLRRVPPTVGPVELVVAPAAIERALDVYEQLHPHDPSVILQARKILTRHIFGMVDQGELDEQRLTVGGLTHLKAVERDHAIKSASNSPRRNKASSPA
jgi:hypothetical protein